MSKDRYRVWTPGYSQLYTGDSIEDAVSVFARCVGRSPSFSFSKHRITGESLVEAFDGNNNKRLCAILVGVTWDEWLEYGPYPMTKH